VCTAVDPQLVATAPRPRRVVAEVPRSGVVAPVPRSVAAAPRSRGRATAGPLCGQAAASLRPRGGGTSNAGEQAAPVDVRVAMGRMRREVRASGVTEDARCAQL
jgi:FAD/FMN-containing dehydrogenase